MKSILPAIMESERIVFVSEVSFTISDEVALCKSKNGPLLFMHVNTAPKDFPKSISKNERISENITTRVA
ncbi:hypothetical protein FACS1894126_1260 [Alphaproteobacteria bacterium]|nr:hypothetical protein FACS1894126_1260 [Alphaproteobacteria bacterium]